MMRYFSIILLIVLSLNLFSTEVLNLTLNEAIELAKENNKMIVAQRSQIKKAQGLKMEAESMFFPKISLSLNYLRTDNPVYVFMGKLTQENFQMEDFDIQRLNNPSSLNNTKLQVTFGFPLYTGGKLLAYKRISQYNLLTTENRFKELEENIIEKVKEAYFGVLLAKSVVRVYEEALKTALEHESQIEKMHREGLVLDSDLLRMRVFRQNTERDLISKKADLEIAKSYLSYVIGVEKEVEPIDEFAFNEEEELNLKELIDIGLQNRPELKAFNYQYMMAKENVKVAKSEYFPQISFGSGYERNYDDDFNYGKNWFVGVELKLSLFDGGAKKSKLVQAKADETSSYYMFLDLKKKIEVEIKEAYLKMKSAREGVKLALLEIEEAKENQRVVSKRYEEGLATITELLDADLTNLASNLSKEKAIYDYIVQKAKLVKALGGDFLERSKR